MQSTLESHFLHQVLRSHQLPEGVRQISLSKGTRSDVVLEEYRVVVELDGRRGHEGEAKWRDAYRDNRHLLSGYVTLRFGWHDVVLTPAEWPGCSRPCCINAVGPVSAGRVAVVAVGPAALSGVTLTTTRGPNSLGSGFGTVCRGWRPIVVAGPVRIGYWPGLSGPSVSGAPGWWPIVTT
ncbi:DUF559 domain-containing protein [Tessaracoccus sp. HDW20]|uniref:DUF559 domain-containing protein n=1 Tax=Tessaracoccus coleopterorum TaxID=2714950 RepID=UPI0018D3CA42|nr:DUF559 domain-containing protein [Tessaracoccus coleopterorum]